MFVFNFCIFNSLAAKEDKLSVNATDLNLNASFSNQTVPEWVKPPSFSYTAEDKNDPFKPFIQTASEEANEKSRQGPVPPIQDVSVSQLTLVGVMLNNNQGQPKALVELPNGKGYILKPGMRVGNNEGVVVNITPQSVVVEEEGTNLFNKKIKKNIVLKLHKSSGESND